MPRRSSLALAAGLLAVSLASPGLVVAASAPAAPAGATQAAPIHHGLRLVMVDLKGCTFCAAFRREVMPAYSARPEGRRAPLAIVPIDGPWPDGIALAARPRVTPTFILLRNGVEQARIEGYASPDSFWPALRSMLNTATETTP